MTSTRIGNLPILAARMIEVLKQESIGSGHPLSLTLEQLSALVIFVGCSSGFVVTVESPVQYHRRRGRVDCVWNILLRDGRLTAITAWEFDGHRVSKSHLLGNSLRCGTLNKLVATRAPIMVQATYSRDGKGPRRNDFVADQCHKFKVHHLRDRDLLTGAFNDVVQNARSEARKL